MKSLFILPVILLAGASCLCAQVRPQQSFQVKMQSYKAQKCVTKTSCVDVNLSWPVIDDANVRVREAINDSIRQAVYFAAEADPSLPLPQALDTATAYAFDMLKDQLANMQGYDMGYSYELTSKTLATASHYVSFELSSSAFSGGAHGNSYTQVTTYSLVTGRAIRLNEVIKDTLALRPLLEKAFVREKTEDEKRPPLLSDILFEEFKHLPMPQNFAIVPEGLRFVYNPYEVAAYVFGPTDFVLTWEQLGKLADRKAWVAE